MKKIIFALLVCGTASISSPAHAGGHEVGNGGDENPYLIYMGSNNSVMISCPVKGEFMCTGPDCINAIRAKDEETQKDFLDKICSSIP